MTVPFAFANLSGNIALSKLDSNFNTPITIGNTSVQLGNTVTTLNNLTLANVTITSGTSNVTNVNVTNINVVNVTATLANVTTLNATSAFITTGNIATANVGNLTLLNALTVPNGGTGMVTLPVNNVLLGNGTSPVASVVPGNVGNVLTSTGSTWISNAVPQLTNVAPNTASYILVSANGNLASGRVLTQGGNVTINDNGPGNTIVISATSGSPGGANTTIQFNNSGAFGGDANLTFSGSTLTSANLIVSNLTGSLAVFSSSTKQLVSNPITGTGSVVMNASPIITSPSLITPALGSPTSGNMVATTSIPVANATGTLAVANGGTGVTASTGSGSVVLNTSPTLTTPTLISPVLGTPTSGSLVATTNIPVANATGTLAVANGGTGLTATPTNGQIDIGNGSGFTRTTLTAGTNVTITNGSGSITIAASGAGGSPGGSNTQVQYNNSGAFAGSANLTFDGTTLTAAGLSGPHNGTVGATTASTGAFTTLSASSTVSGTGFSTYLASPPAIGGTAAAAGTFTTGTFNTSTVHKGATSGTVTISAPAVAGTQSYTLPTAVPAANGYALTSTTGGTMSWSAITASAGGSTTQVQYNNGGSLAGISGFTSDGTRVTASTTIGVGGATPSTSGSGITFPSNTSVSSNANTLDDYEVGTWPPTLGGTATYATQTGTYIKIGRLVYITCVLETILRGTGSTTTISGLPFTTSTGPLIDFPLSIRSWSGLATNVLYIVPVAKYNLSTIEFNNTSTAGTATGALTVAIFGNSTKVDFAGFYYTNL